MKTGANDQDGVGLWQSVTSSAEPGLIFQRLVESDPLDLFPTCAARIRERAFLLDSQRIFEMCAAQIALKHKDIQPTADRGWLLGIIDLSMDRAMAQDREKDREGCTEEDEYYEFLVEGFAIEPSIACSAAVTFNALDDIHRTRFFAVLDHRSIARCEEDGLGTKLEIAESMRVAMFAMKYLDDSVIISDKEPT